MASAWLWDELEFFEPTEFDYPENMDDEFLVRLNYARLLAGVPFIINTDHRPGDERAHGYGKAVDIQCTDSHKRFAIISGALQAGFRRIGVYDLHIHLDYANADDDERFRNAQDVIWTGKSR